MGMSVRIVTGNLKEPFSWPFEIVSSSAFPFFLIH
jgi:hypothetical protein